MITSLRLVVLLARPAVAVLLSMYAAIGAGRAGRTDYGLLSAVVLVVLGYLLFSVCINDLADQAIDRINLAGDPRRPLVVGSAGRSDMRAMATAGAVTALGAAAVLGVAVLITTAAGLAVSFGYSVRPVRLADRGAVAALVLPACYVVVPYLDGYFAAGGSPAELDRTLLAGLYLGFLGRILLKDFRDVRGDALFGKRTFLVRHGRAATCCVSIVLLVLGTLLIECALGLRGLPLDVCYTAGAVASALVIKRLADDPHPRRDERRISAVAILGRGMLITLLAQLLMQQRNMPAGGALLVLGWLAATTALQALLMLRYGPRPRLTSAALPHTAAPEQVAEDIVAG
jgi:4-hydroxybenzoate polyprenyltransferase